MGNLEYREGLVGTKFVKHVKGGTDSAMIRASDGQYYVVKTPQNPQHRRAVVNDFIAGSLAHRVGLPTPRSVVVYVPSDLIPPRLSGSEGSPAPHGPGSVFAGSCFGSRVPADPYAKAIYDCIPLSLWGEVVNRDVALGCWLFDCWTSNRDQVQVVFHRVRRKKQLAGCYWLTKIDHGYCFEAEDWSFVDTKRPIAYWQAEAFRQFASLNEFEPYYSAIQSVTLEAANEILRQIPAAWQSSGERDVLQSLAKRLMRRARLIRSLIDVWWPLTASLRPRSVTTHA